MHAQQVTHGENAPGAASKFENNFKTECKVICAVGHGQGAVF